MTDGKWRTAGYRLDGAVTRLLDRTWTAGNLLAAAACIVVAVWKLWPERLPGADALVILFWIAWVALVCGLRRRNRRPSSPHPRMEREIAEGCDRAPRRGRTNPQPHPRYRPTRVPTRLNRG